jgi:uroporphyrinogen-III synthase
LITRPAAEAATTADHVRNRGWTPVVAPLLRIEALDFAPPRGIHGLVVTSGNAIANWAPFHMLDVPMLAVGDATAARARAAGFTQVMSASGDAASVAAKAPACFPPGARLLFPTAENEGLPMAAALRAAGFTVERRLAYAVHPAPALPATADVALRNGSLRAALFLSARTARTFAALLPPDIAPLLADIEALAIGQPAADILTPLPWRRVRVSLAPSLDQVLALL